MGAAFKTFITIIIGAILDPLSDLLELTLSFALLERLVQRLMNILIALKLKKISQKQVSASYLELKLKILSCYELKILST